MQLRIVRFSSRASVQHPEFLVFRAKMTTVSVRAMANSQASLSCKEGLCVSLTDLVGHAWQHVQACKT